MQLMIQDVIDSIISAIPGAPFEETVDTIKTGDASRPVTGIVTTFLATSEVIQKAIDYGANLIITHEPTFYEHLDGTDWLVGDPVYEAKRRLIDEHDIVIWRFHDYWHYHRPDGILTGVLKELGWDSQADETRDQSSTSLDSFEELFAAAIPTFCFDIRPISLRDLAEMFKRKLDIRRVRMVGDPEMVCSRIALSVGKLGGQFQIKLIGQDDVDVLVCGEINEWETCEYVRDANNLHREKGLIILGHAASEEPGMRWCADWLRSSFPEVRITHIAAGDPFRVV